MERWGFLLLCSHLGNPQRRPLTTAQLRLLTTRVRGSTRGAASRDLTVKDLQGMGYARESAEHILGLLHDTELLREYLRKGAARKCVPLTRQDSRYPLAVRQRLGLDSPGTLWAKGDLGLLERQKVSLVGSRVLRQDNLRFAQKAGAEAARQGCVLVSGNAPGADQAAQRSCLEAGGSVIVVVADALHSHLAEERVLHLSEEDYDVPFSPLRALRRNRVIHTLGMGVLAAQCSNGTGGTWSGTTQNLNMGWTPVRCFDDGSPGMRALLSMGARSAAMEDLEDYRRLFRPEPTLFDPGHN